MYKTKSVEKVIEGESKTVYGVTDETGFFLDFTNDVEQAKMFADLLNENKVEPCHVPEIIEDLFYTCE